MARRTAHPPEEVLLCLTMPREEASCKIGERIEKAAALKTLSVEDGLKLRAAERGYTTWSKYNQEMLRRTSTSSTIADEYGSPGGTFTFTRELPIGARLAAGS